MKKDNYGIKVINKNFNPTKREMTAFANRWINKQLYWIPTRKQEKLIEKRSREFFSLYREVDKIYWADSYLDKQYLSAVDSAVVYAVYSAVDSAVYSAVDSAVSSAVRSAVSSFYWSDNISFYSFMSKAVENPFKDFGYAVLGTSGMGFINNDLYFIRKPIIKMKEGRLHSETGMAIKWRDGNGFYFIDGVKVDEKVVFHPDKLTKQDWMDEKNMETRRIIQERMKERFATELGGKVVGKNKDMRIGEVVEVDITPDSEKIAHYLHAQDWSSDRMYFLRIPPDISDPLEAQAWSYSLKVYPKNIIRA